jgi:hypothetical protein
VEVHITSRRKLSAHDRLTVETAVERLGRHTKRYRLCHLTVRVDHVGHSAGCDVKMTLALARRPLIVCDERAANLGPAAVRCVEAVVREVAAARPRSRAHDHGDKRASMRALLLREDAPTVAP